MVGDQFPRDPRVLTLGLNLFDRLSHLIPGMSKTLRYPKITGKCRYSRRSFCVRLTIYPKVMILLSRLVAEVSRREGHLTAIITRSGPLTTHVSCNFSRRFRVFRAVHFEEHRVAACKVVSLTPETKPYDRKMIEKEIQVHSALKHSNVLEFMNAVIVEANGRSRYHPGIYMLLELAAGGDLFDKIGIPFYISHDLKLIREVSSGCWYRRRDCPLLLHTDLIRNGLTTPSTTVYIKLNWPHP